MNKNLFIAVILASSAAASCSNIDEPVTPERGIIRKRAAVAPSAESASEGDEEATEESVPSATSEEPATPPVAAAPPAAAAPPVTAKSAVKAESDLDLPPAEDVAIIKLAGRWFEGLATVVEKSGDNCATIAKAITRYGKSTAATVKKIKAWVAEATTAQKKAVEAYVEEHVDAELDDRADRAAEKIAVARQRCRDNPDVETAIDEWTLK